MTTGKYKRYSWNRNASTNKDAMVKFAFVSFMVTLPLNVPVIIMSWLALRTGTVQSVTPIAAVMPIIHITAWIVVFVMMCAVYNSMNNSNIERGQQSPPPHPDKAGERYYDSQGRPMYWSGKGWVKH